MTLARIHSIESMGLVDGPGIRVVVFMQGCRLRCRFCHNPDTWDLLGGRQMSPQELLKMLLRYRPYFERSGGGVTFSGGEPLMQPQFLEEMLFLCKEAGIHTCLDTAGCGMGNYEAILKNTDLILYDVKEITSEKYQRMTGQSWDETNRFLKAVQKSGTPVWVRHVVVPGLTDSPEHLKALRQFILERVPNVKQVELLPYHLLGVSKYETMGIPYSLKGVPAMDPNVLEEDQKKYFQNFSGGI